MPSLENYAHSRMFPLKANCIRASLTNISGQTKRYVHLKRTRRAISTSTIDGVSHVSWFRKKMSEFIETIGIPKPRQNNNIKL